MKNLCKDKKLVDRATTLGKYGMVHTPDDKILIGSCLVYEDKLWGNVETAVEDLTLVLGLMGKDYTDEIAEIRDFILDRVLERNNKKLVIGEVQY